MKEESIEAWLTRDSDGSLCLFVHKPKKFKAAGSWVPQHIIIDEDENLFQSVKWEDPEPTKILIKIIK